MNKQYVSDIIKNDYEKWNTNDSIIVDCQTGQGKTYFILNTYSSYLESIGKKILILSNRTKLKEELQLDANKMIHKNITIKNYQSIEHSILNGYKIDNYDCIVCDECHYFLSDSWNNKTDVSWKWLLSKNCIKIFMSATGYNVFKMVENMMTKYPDNKIYNYYVDRDYSYVDKVVFYNEDDYVIDLLSELPPDEKAIYFCISVKKAYDTYRIFKDRASFICSQSRPTYNKYITKDAIENERFESQMLFATTCIDNGINLKDRTIKHIFIDIIDLPILIQCLGRKRILDDDTITFHIKNYTKKKLNGYKKSYKDDLMIANAYLNNNIEKLKELTVNRNKKLKSFINANYIDKSLEFNPMIYAYYEIMVESLNLQMRVGFSSEVMNCLQGIDDNKVFYQSDMETKQHKDKIYLYLESVLLKKLFKEEQKELINVINLRDSRNRQQKDIKLLNIFLETNQYPFTLLPKKSDGKRYWIADTIEVVKLATN